MTFQLISLWLPQDFNLCPESVTYLLSDTPKAPETSVKASPTQNTWFYLNFQNTKLFFHWGKRITKPKRRVQKSGRTTKPHLNAEKRWEVKTLSASVKKNQDRFRKDHRLPPVRPKKRKKKTPSRLVLSRLRLVGLKFRADSRSRNRGLGTHTPCSVRSGKLAPHIATQVYSLVHRPHAATRRRCFWIWTGFRCCVFALRRCGVMEARRKKTPEGVFAQANNTLRQEWCTKPPA